MKKAVFLSLIVGSIVIFASCSQSLKIGDYEQPEMGNYEQPKVGNYDITAWVDIAGNDKIAVIYNGELREYSVENGVLSYIRSDSTNTYFCFANDPHFLIAITSTGTVVTDYPYDRNSLSEMISQTEQMIRENGGNMGQTDNPDVVDSIQSVNSVKQMISEFPQHYVYLNDKGEVFNEYNELIVKEDSIIQFSLFDSFTALLDDGSLWSVNDSASDVAFDSWSNITYITGDSANLFDVDSQGNVLSTDKNIALITCEWKDVCELSYNVNTLVALTSSGTAYACKGRYAYEYNQTDVSDWHDLISVYTNGVLTVGLTSNGSVLVTDSKNQ